MKGKLVLAGTATLFALGFLFAHDFTWQFMYNMKWPMTIFSVIALVICTVMIISTKDSLQKERRPAQSEILEWRLWTTINFAIMIGCTWLVIQAIPKPDFKKQIQYVNRIVDRKIPVIRYVSQKQVYKAPSYAEAFKLCSNGITLDGHATLSDSEAKQCHEQALLAALPDDRKLVITRTVVKNSTPKAFSDIFNNCVASYDTQVGDDQQSVTNRSNRMEVCRKVALAATTGQ